MTEVCAVVDGTSVTEFSEQSVGSWLVHLTVLDAVLPKLIVVTLLCGFIESYIYQLAQIIFTEVNVEHYQIRKLILVTAAVSEHRLLNNTTVANSASIRCTAATARSISPG